MRHTYNPIEGPFETAPQSKPGRTVVLDTGAGELREAVARRLLPPPASSPELHRAGDHLASLRKGAARGGLELFEAARQTWFGRKYLGGRARSYYLVDISRQTIGGEFLLPSRESTLHFVADVTCDVRVVDPVRAVAEGITDVFRHIATELRRRLARVAAEQSARELAETQSRMQAVLDRPALAVDPVDRAILLERAHVVVRLDPEAQKWLRAKEVSGLHTEAVEAEGAVRAAARRLAAEATTSFDSLLAEWVATRDDALRIAMEHRLSELRAGDKQRFEWAEMMMSKGVIEAHDLHARYPDLVDRVLGYSIPAAPAPATTPALPSPARPALAPPVEIRLPRPRRP